MQRGKAGSMVQKRANPSPTKKPDDYSNYSDVEEREFSMISADLPFGAANSESRIDNSFSSPNAR